MSNIWIEKDLSYEGISLENALVIKYLLSNMPIFEEGSIVRLSLKKLDNYIEVNGLLSNIENKTFDCFIYEEENAYRVYTVIEDIFTHKDKYSIDYFTFKEKDIQVISYIEKRDALYKKISYWESLNLRK